MSVWLDGTVGHLQEAVHSLSENKQDHKLLDFFFFSWYVCLCVCMCECGGGAVGFFLYGKKENGISLTQRSEPRPAHPCPHQQSLSPGAFCMTLPSTQVLPPMPLILPLPGDEPHACGAKQSQLQK